MIRILQWNINNSALNTETALRDSSDYDVISIQEPHLTKHAQPWLPSNTPYYLVPSQGRAAIYLHRRWDLTTWTSQSGPDWCSVTLYPPQQQPLTIWSIYSPNPHLPEWQSPLTHLATTQLRGRHFIVGDFNLHHPLWDRHHRTSPRVDTLLNLVNYAGLSLVTPPGLTTWSSHDRRDSTIDLAWTSPSLSVYGPTPLDYTGSDHIPLTYTIRATAPKPQRCPGWNWKTLDAHLATSLSLRIPTFRPQDGANPTALDNYTNHLVTALTGIANSCANQKRTAQRPPTPWWNTDTAATSQTSRQAYRRWSANRTDVNWTNYRQAHSLHKHTVAKAKRLHWRRDIDAITQQPPTLWRLAKWARLRSHAPYEDPHLPPLTVVGDGDTIATSH